LSKDLTAREKLNGGVFTHAMRHTTMVLKEVANQYVRTIDGIRISARGKFGVNK